MNSLEYKYATVKEIHKDYDDLQQITAWCQDKEHKAINYTLFNPKCKIGDKIILNTTATELSLGTGGFDFVVLNLSSNNNTLNGEGHIMKLRYTPFQFKTLSVEEQQSQYHDDIKDFKNLDKFPVTVGNLHSQVSVFFETYRALSGPDKVCVYIMTDAAALPIALSNNIRRLKDNNVIDYTITTGNAFGGDFEAVNVYSAIIMARAVLKADAIMVCMGPGIVGTGTKYGFTGIEQGYILDAVTALGGTPVAIPRISFSDKRERHYGLSHHTVTVLKDISNSKCIVPYSIDNYDRSQTVLKQISENALDKRHKFINIESNDNKSLISGFIVKPSSMGRDYKDEPELFDACIATAKLISGGNFND